MSINCIKCVVNKRTGPDLLCEICRANKRIDEVHDLYVQRNMEWLREHGKTAEGPAIREASKQIFIDVLGPFIAPNPFENGKKIRKGKLDTEIPDYEQITGWIQRVPKTWLSGILNQCIASCMGNKVFNRMSIVKYVKNMAEIYNCMSIVKKYEKKYVNSSPQA